MMRLVAALLCLILIAAPLAADARAVGKARIGYLSSNPQSDPQDAIDAFRARLSELGHRERESTTAGQVARPLVPVIPFGASQPPPAPPGRHTLGARRRSPNGRA
jgi:hypothetical protein